MRKLDRKLLRDLQHMKGQVLAIVAVIAAGVATFVMSMCAYASLEWSKDYFYREFRFANIFTSARRAPLSLVPGIERLSGVAAVEARLVFDVLLDLAEMTEPATARLISSPRSYSTSSSRGSSASGLNKSLHSRRSAIQTSKSACITSTCYSSSR